MCSQPWIDSAHTMSILCRLSPIAIRPLLASLVCTLALAACQNVPPTTTPVAAAPAAASSAYRQAAAHHLYQRYADRIYPGPLPPELYAVGVLALDIDRQGRVQQLQWLRAPEHAPEVVAEIETLVRAAAPYPAAPAGARYTEVWLWDESGRFQLDTLTEGQLPALAQ